MTDEQINRLVAERVTGWRPISTDPPRWEHDGIESWLADVPHYCTDPAAWGALLVWLGEQRKMPQLDCSSRGKWRAIVGDTAPSPDVWDDRPGRALALAALRAYGVEV